MTAPQTYPTGSQQISPPQGQVAISDGPQISQFQMVSGTFTANQTSSVTVAAPALTATSAVIIYLITPGGTVGAIPTVKTRSPGTGFTTAASASDTSTYGYLIIG